MSISELIATVSERLTPTERRIAQAVLDEPTLLAFGTVSNLADKVGTSRPSIVRFRDQAGLSGLCRPAEAHVRQGMSRDLSRPSQRIRNQGDPGASTQGALAEAIDRVFEALQGEQLAQLAAPIISAKNVWILTGETSRAGAHALLSGLTMVRPNVALIEEHASGRDLSSAGPGDAAIVLGLCALSPSLRWCSANVGRGRGRDRCNYGRSPLPASLADGDLVRTLDPCYRPPSTAPCPQSPQQS